MISIRAQQRFGTFFLILYWLIVLALIVETKLSAPVFILTITASGLGLLMLSGVLYLHWSYSVYIIFLAFEGLYAVDQYGSHTYAHNLFEFFLLLSWFVSRALGRVGPYRSCALDVPLGCFLTLNILSIFWSGNRWLSISFSIKFILILAGSFYATMVIVRDRSMLQRVLSIILAIAVLNSILCYLLYLAYPDIASITIVDPGNLFKGCLSLFLNEASMGRRGHGLAHQIITSIWLSFGVHILFYRLLSNIVSLRKKLCYIALMLFFLSAMQTTLSKMPVLALAASFTVHVLMTRSLQGWFLTTMSLFLSLLILAFVLGNSADLTNAVEYTQHGLNASAEYSSTESRITWWSQVITAGLDHSGLGCGSGNSIAYLDPQGPHAHNAYIAAFSELGYPGLLLFLGIIVMAAVHFLSSLRNCSNLPDRNLLVMLFSMYLNILLNIMTNGSYLEPLLWFIMALNLATIRIVQERGDAPEQRHSISSSIQAIHSRGIFDRGAGI